MTAQDVLLLTIGAELLLLGLGLMANAGRTKEYGGRSRRDVHG
jgi:hypothetical protein